MAIHFHDLRSAASLFCKNRRLLYGFCTGASAVRYSVDNSSTQVKFRRIHVELSEHNWANISETVAPKCLFLTRGPLGRCSSRISWQIPKFQKFNFHDVITLELYWSSRLYLKLSTIFIYLKNSFTVLDDHSFCVVEAIRLTDRFAILKSLLKYLPSTVINGVLLAKKLKI